MELEQQVCNSSLAKRLKKLGVKQESLFYYAANSKDIYLSAYEKDSVSAFTVAELGNILKNINKIKNMFVTSEYLQMTYKNNFKWICSLNETNKDVIFKQADTEADARAKMLIYLLENKLIKL